MVRRYALRWKGSRFKPNNTLVDEANVGIHSYLKELIA